MLNPSSESALFLRRSYYGWSSGWYYHRSDDDNAVIEIDAIDRRRDWEQSENIDPLKMLVENISLNVN